jgi:hypothetical protein
MLPAEEGEAVESVTLVVIMVTLALALEVALANTLEEWIVVLVGEDGPLEVSVSDDGPEVMKIGVDELEVLLTPTEAVVMLLGKGPLFVEETIIVTVCANEEGDIVIVSPPGDTEVAVPLPMSEVNVLFVGYGAWLVVYAIEVVEMVEDTVMIEIGRDDVLERFTEARVSVIVAPDALVSVTVSTLVELTG